MTVNQFIVRKSPALSVRVLKNFERCVQQGTLGWVFGLLHSYLLMIVCFYFLLFVCLSLEEAILHIVVCSVPWPLNRSEAEGDLFLTNLLEIFYM